MVPLRACALADHIVEVRFGSGHNIEAYPATVSRVSAIEPSDDGWLLGGDRGLVVCRGPETCYRPPLAGTQ